MNQSHNHNPNEATYIPQARRALTAHRLRSKAADDELAAKRATAQAMNSVRVREFEFRDDKGKKFRARLKRGEGQRISVQKLYTLVREGELSLDDFLECVKADEKFVRDYFSEDKVQGLMETYQKGLDLEIVPCKGK